MKKRVVSVLCATLLLVSACLPGLSVQAEVIADRTNVYNLYATAGTKGTESVLMSGMQMVTNTGDAATAIGGNYGVTVKQPTNLNYSVIVNTSSTIGNDVVDPIDGTTVKYFSNGVSGDNPSSSNGYGMYSPKANATTGGTVVLRNNVISFRLFMYCAHAFDDGNEMKFYVSDKQDGTFREIDAKRSGNKNWTGQWHAYVYEPADFTQIKETDKFLKFVFTKPRTNQDDHVYQIAQIDYTCKNTLIAHTVNFDDTSVNKMVPYISDNAQVKPGNTVDTNLSPRATNIRFKEKTVGDTTMEILFTSDDVDLNFDIQDIEIHVSQKPDCVFETPVLSVCDTLNGTYEEVKVRTTATTETKWAKSVIYSFADPYAIQTKNIRYVKFAAKVPGDLQTPHYSVSCADLMYEPESVSYEEPKAETNFVIYHTPCIDDFDAQINFKDGTEDDAIVKAYVTDDLDSEAFREIGLQRTAGKLTSSADAVAPWASCLYSPVDGAVLGNYLKIEVVLPENSAGDTYQFIDLATFSSIDFDHPAISDILAYVSDNAKISTASTVNTALSPRATNLRLKATTSGNVTMEAIFSADESSFDSTIENIQIHVSRTPDKVFTEPVIAVSDALNGTYENVELLSREAVNETTWCKSFVYSFAHPEEITTENIRYVKFSATVPDGVQTPHFNVSYVDFFCKPQTVTLPESKVAYPGEIAYRTVNMTDFDVQINFEEGTENAPVVKAYVADVNRADRYREIQIERVAGKLADAPTPADAGSTKAWVSYLYSPVAGQELGDYLKIEIQVPEYGAVGSCQFMGLTFTDNDEDMKIFNFSETTVEAPVRKEGYVAVRHKTDVDQERMGGKASYQLYKAEEGYMIFNIQNLQSFRAYFSTDKAPSQLQLSFYVASKDVDDLYVPIECKYEVGLRSGAWKNYMFTPCNPDDIPAGVKYLKIVGTSNASHNLMLLEGDLLSQVKEVQSVENGDLTAATLTNLQANTDGGLSVIDITKESSMILSAENMTWFKAAVTASKSIADKVQVTWYTADSADGPFTELTCHAFASTTQISGCFTNYHQLSEKGESVVGDYLKMVISPITEGSGTVTLDQLVYHHSLVTISLPALKECPDDMTELLDTFETENIVIEDGGKAYYAEMMQWGELTYGYESNKLNGVYRIDPDVDAFIVYHTEDPIQYVDIRALRITEHTNTNLSFAFSADGENWEWLDADAVQTFVELYEGGKEGVAYQLSDVPENMYYLRIEVPVLESPDVTEISITGVQIHSQAAVDPEIPATGELAVGQVMALVTAALALLVCGMLRKRSEAV